MSVEAVEWLVGAPPPVGTRKVSALTVFRVLLAYAVHADEYGANAYPSQRTLAAQLDTDRRTIRDAIAALVEQEYLKFVAPAIRRVCGDSYSLVIRDRGGGIPRPNAAVEIPAIGAGESPRLGRASGRATGRGNPPPRNVEPRITPPTPSEILDAFDDDTPAPWIKDCWCADCSVFVPFTQTWRHTRHRMTDDPAAVSA